MPRPSLRLQLLQRLLPALIVLLLAGAVTAYWVAWRNATKAYDRALVDTALAIVEQLQQVDGRLQLPLTQQARAILLLDKFDRVYYAVHGPGGELLDGVPGLPMPETDRAAPSTGEVSYYYDGILDGEPLRIAALQVKVAEQSVTVLAGETLIKRKALIREILLGMLLPEMLLTLACIGIVWFGVRAGLDPLLKMRQELAERSHEDLSPVQVLVPEEIQPVATEINELLQRLDCSLTSQRNFVSDAAHQLRNPIAALQAQLEAALCGTAENERERFAGVQAAAHRLSHLVDQMLALARAEPSLAQTHEVALEEVVRQVAENCLPRAIGRQIDLGFELVPLSVRGNPLLLQEMLGNLLDNALRHTPAGGSITVSCGSQGEFVWLQVEDSGSGIPESGWVRVLERFYQLPGSPQGGSGLGLAIVREIARQHGGDVAVGVSARLGGAAIRVTLSAASRSA